MILMSAVCLSVLAAGAAPDYTASGKKIGAGAFDVKSKIAYLAMGDGVVYALETTGAVHAFNTDSGKHEFEFASGLNGTQAIAVNDKGEIHVLATRTEEKEFERSGRKYTRRMPVGVDCKVFDAKGKELREMKLECLKSAKAAKFAGDKLVVADVMQRALIFIDPATGEKTSEVKDGLRLCCGIFDFCLGPNDNVTVANLAAFKVQQYSPDGKKLESFGQRGKGIDDFHGCCNPVSLCYLPGGRVMTVEKSPSRVKICDADGKNAKVVAGIEELVQGCSHIPLAIDGKGNVFLAANRRGQGGYDSFIVKCVPTS